MGSSFTGQCREISIYIIFYSFYEFCPHIEQQAFIRKTWLSGFTYFYIWCPHFNRRFDSLWVQDGDGELAKLNFSASAGLPCLFVACHQMLQWEEGWAGKIGLESGCEGANTLLSNSVPLGSVLFPKDFLSPAFSFLSLICLFDQAYLPNT